MSRKERRRRRGGAGIARATAVGAMAGAATEGVVVAGNELGNELGDALGAGAAEGAVADVVGAVVASVAFGASGLESHALAHIAPAAARRRNRHVRQAVCFRC